jgi:asparagine synthase (glutamine-hydrolysing)
VSEAEFKADLPRLLDAMDQPSIDGVNAWFVSKAAHECGLKVALSGLGGDELLAGYRSFVDVPRMVRGLGPVTHLPGLGATVRQVLRTLFPEFARRNPKLVSLLEYSGSWPAAYLLRRGLFLMNELGDVLPPEIARDGLRRLEPYALIRRSMAPEPRSDLARVCALESQNYMRNQLLRDADWAGMAHSLEVRVPFVDIRLLEELAPCLTRLPPGTGKATLANVPSRPLPADVINRAKTGFDVPIGAWINNALGSSKLAKRGNQSRAWARIVIKNWDAAAAIPEVV